MLLLKAILDFTPVRAGRVELDGRPVAGQRSRVAYVPQREAIDKSFPITAALVVLIYPPSGWLRAQGGTTALPSGRCWPASARPSWPIARSARAVGRRAGI